MTPEDEEKTAFITGYGLYYWKVMPLGLKNAGATYQRTVNSIFVAQIGRNMEIYVDDMLVKSKERADHLENLRKTFNKLRESRLKINPEKCSFGVMSGRFLGYMISKRGIEPNPDKIEALLMMRPPNNYKEVQKLTRCLAALNRFISKLGERILRFLNNLRCMSKENFSWDEDSKEAFEELKRYLGSPQLLSRPEVGEQLQLYLTISDVAVSSVILREVEGVQKPIYYVSHVLRYAEERYPIIDKAAFTLVISTRKLKAYFESHPIQVVTNQPLKRVLSSPSLSRQLTTCVIELSEFEISYVPRTSVKVHALVDFVTECTARPPPIIQGPRADDQSLAKPDWVIVCGWSLQ
ncbi:hypothetical protein LIER_43282 [Lithospermum erythrorhizon]|uniref:Reverse transcriptase domain-containing protein n=1 Tax=Lithospermum erythrorhizon TaxID=34254 RepID=A0AAV3PS89_LITER